MKSWVGCVLVGGAAVWSGCMAHVPLPEAPTTASHPVRMQAYHTFRPVSMQYTTTVSYGRYGVTGMSTAATGLMLANGTNVFFPEDLVPLAGANSPTAVAAREHESANNTADILTWSGVGASVLGMALFSWGMLGGFNSFSSSSSGFGVPLMITGGVLSLGGGITVLVGSGFRGHAARQREAAYQLYDQSLRQNLGLCGDGSQLGDCAPSTGGDGAVPPPPPNPNVNVTVGTPVVVPLGAR
jgi:hypothetical protein